MRLSIILCQLIALGFIQYRVHGAISVDLDESLLDEALETEHCIIGHGIVILLVGVLPLQLIVPGQLFLDFSLTQLLRPLLILDLLLGPAAFGPDLKCKH